MKLSILWMLPLALLLGGCQNTAKPLSPSELVANHNRVLIFENYSNSLTAFKEQLDNVYRPRVEHLLESHNIEFVPPTRFFEILKELKENSTVALFDPITGQKNTQLHQKLVHQALAQVKQELNLNAFVSYGVVVKKAYFNNNIFSGYVAEWDNSSESYVHGGAGAGDFFKSFVVSEGGNVPAASFVIFFEDENEKSLSWAAGGIEILGTFDGDEYKPKPQEELFDQKEQINQAFDWAAEILNGKPQK